MSMINESALVWIGDEVRATLRELKIELEAVPQTQSAQRTSVLAGCAEKIGSIAGAFRVANCEPLSQYANALQDVIQLWRDSPSSILPQAVTTTVAASQSLGDFLQAIQEQKPLSELALFDDYQRLGVTLSRAFSPVQLWPKAEGERCLNAWSQQGFVAELERHVQHRMSFYDAQTIGQYEVDVLMLGLIRHQKMESSAALQLVCHWRALQHTSSAHLITGVLISVVLESVSKGALTLDTHLKRYLLSSLSWLKGNSSEEAFLHESAFFCFLVWQAEQHHSTPLASEALVVLNLLAQTADWQALQGTIYSQIHFDSQARELLAQAKATTTVTKQLWSDFCAVQPTVGTTTPIKLEDLALSFDKMGQSLEALHPAAGRLSQAFHLVVSDTQLCAKRDTQIEVATLLLILSSMLADMKGRSDVDTEHHLLDLVRRLEHLRNGQMLGAFDPWMLELQQRQDWAQAMTSTTDVLGQKLTEVEGVFERLWASPHDTSELLLVPSKLQQIRSIAHSLKLEDFANAVLPVESKIEMLTQNQHTMSEVVQKQIAADLAGLGLMLSMWAHKPEPAYLAASIGQQVEQPIEHIFLMEAQEVLVQAHADLAQLSEQPEHIETLIAIRRAFHTIKGGARVVGLAEFGEAAWLIEQYLNDKLAQQQLLDPRAIQLCADQVTRMQNWTQQLQAQHLLNGLTLDTSAIDWQLSSLRESIQASQSAHHAPTFPDFPPSDFLDLPAESLSDAEETTETQIKTIGDLQISIPLYQAYLNETDEWSRQLALVLSEWALDETQLMPSQALTWAHALAGSSATVGFESCAELAKLTERLIERTQAQSVYSVDLAQTLADAADEIRRLLHQFAAGFLKAADTSLIDKLHTYLDAASLGQEAMQMPVPLKSVAQAEQIAFMPIQAMPMSVNVDPEVKAVFEEESSQLISELGTALRTWDKSQVLRTLHTLKGSARLVGEQSLAQHSHNLESQIEAISDKPNEEQLATLLQAYDQMVAPSMQQLMPLLNQAAVQPALLQPFVAVPSGETIRVQSSTVDRLVNQTGELMIARSRMEAEMARSLRTLSDMGLQVQRLRDQLREMEIQTESQMQSRQTQVTDAANSFDPLELDRFTRTQELTRFMAEALSDMSTLQRSLQRSLNTTEDDLAAQLRQTRDLQRNLLRTRMVEFDSAGERLHRLVRMTSLELGKSIDLTIQNGRQEMDRLVLERMLPVFEHLLRNAVVHGIELPTQREAKGKPVQGRITIQLSQQSNDVIVSLYDDGSGIDQEALLAKARTRLGQPQLMADAAELIFMSGLSTATEVSELAGRGIGMDVVRSQIFALGGRIEVASTQDAGTSFKLILPLTTAVTQIVLVRTGAQMTGIPGNLVNTIVRVKPDQIMQAWHNKSFTHADQTYPFFDLGQLLQYKSQAAELDQPTQNVIILQSAGQMIALHVDEVLGNQEVMVKNLGVQLAQMPGLSGMTVLPTGPTVLIYNPVALAAIYGPSLVTDAVTTEGDKQTNSADAFATAQDSTQAPLVLVVDDSITMRRVLQRLLQREGYRVAVAADGRQALDTLRLERPALVLSDVEMPRMDGFELLRSIRASDKLSQLPVVMITSRIADKHRDHAKELGANEYLGKPYSEDELLQVLERYAAKANTSLASV